VKKGKCHVTIPTVSIQSTSTTTTNVLTTWNVSATWTSARHAANTYCTATAIANKTANTQAQTFLEALATRIGLADRWHHLWLCSPYTAIATNQQYDAITDYSSYSTADRHTDRWTLTDTYSNACPYSETNAATKVDDSTNFQRHWLKEDGLVHCFQRLENPVDV